MKDNIFIFGSFVVDLMSRNSRLPLPGETVKGDFFKLGPGGKGSNQAIAAKRAEGNITFSTKLGNDYFGGYAKEIFVNEDLDSKYIFQDNQNSTGAALIMVDDVTSENKISVVLGACENFTQEEVASLGEELDNCKWLLTQLETNIDATEKVIKAGKEKKINVILNPAPIQPIDESIFRGLHTITPNETEASSLTGIEVNDVESAKKASEILADKGVKNVIITLGSKGCLVRSMDRVEFIPSFRVEAVDTTGAGDAFNGGLVTALAEGQDIFDAARFGNALAALSVTKLGTAPSMPLRKDIENLLKNSTQGEN